MKAKKLLPVIATSLAVFAFVGCTAGSQTVKFAPYWEKQAEDLQNTFEEVLTYDVTFDKEGASGLEGIGYALDYKEGTYTTSLVKKDNVTYEYTTTLSIKVSYDLKNDDKEGTSYEDYVWTKVTFQSAQKNSLKPIQSEKRMIIHAPLDNNKPTAVEDCFIETNYAIVTKYDTENDKINRSELTKRTDKEKSMQAPTQEGAAPVQPTVQEFSKGKKLTYLDNEQILFALRGISTETTSAKFQAYAPLLDQVQTVGLTFTASEENETQPQTLTVNGVKSDLSFKYRTASVKLNEKNPGATQEAILSIGENDRNLLLQFTTPLSYSFGSLIYTLTTVTRVE